MKTLKSRIIIFACCLLLITAGCKKNKSVGYGSMAVRMTDVPAVYSSVNVNIQSIAIHFEDERKGSGGWVLFATNSGFYDLLKLQNDVTVVLANEKVLPLGQVSQLRLILGDGNTVATGGVVYPLVAPSGMQTGIKIDVNTEIKYKSHIDITLDFDADSSVVLEGNGTFSLKPVIKIKSIVQY